MHRIDIGQRYIDKVVNKVGKLHSVESLDGPRTALIVVDMQHYFMGPGQPSECPVAREIVPNVNRLAAATRAAGGMVVWIQTISGPESRDFWSVYYERTTPEGARARVDGMSPGGSGFDLWPELEVKDGDEIVLKNKYSAFIQGSSNLDDVLRSRGIDTLLITGVSTCTCCESTARDGMMLNYRTLMVSDGCAAPDDDLHNATLRQFYLQFGDVQSTDELIALLTRKAAPVSAAAAE